jgi:hypothetical protein
MKPVEKELLRSLTELREALKNDPRIQKLDSLEKRIAEDSFVVSLSKAKEAAENRYEDRLAFQKASSEECQCLQKELYLAKKALDENPLVREYNAAFTAVRDLYMAIDDILFRDYRKKAFFEEAHLC